MNAIVPAPVTATEHRPRVVRGWRQGRPVEDPEKIKRWGFVSAKPSEFLVHVRRGRVTKRSGQGASCFKWPWDSVAIVPTSLQQLGFQADQVTLEKIGVEIVGLAVYRIVEPLLAFRVLNFSFPERAQEKLEETLTAMFVGATRRLVANLTVEECMQKRKSALASELLREIAPVVGGEGKTDDTTDRGWGVVIDTIEIQEVRVLSETVFAAMQAPVRALLDQRAREAVAQAEKAIATQQAACEREIGQAQIETQEAVAARKAEAERRAYEAAVADQLHRGELELDRQRAELEADRQLRASKLAAEADLRRQELEQERQQTEERHQQALRRQELEAEQARVALEAAELQGAWEAQRAEQARGGAVLEAELRRLAAWAAQIEGEAAATVELRRAEAALQLAEADARRMAAQNLPALAAAIGSRISEVKMAHYGAGESPFAQLAAGLRSFMDLIEKR